MPLDLKPGVNRIDFVGASAHIEPDSVILRDPSGRALQILEQNYRNDPVSQELLLSYYEGKTIDFLTNLGQGPVTIKGKIIRSGYTPAYTYAGNYQPPTSTQPIVEVDGTMRFGLPGEPLFPALGEDTTLKPKLSWLLETDKPGKSNAELSYVSGGMNWHADYNLVVSDKENGGTNLVDLVGWITMENHSGKTFENATIKLMAGDVNKLVQGGIAGGVFAAKAQRMVADEAMAPSSRKNPSTSFISTPCNIRPRCMTRKPSRSSSLAPRVSARSACTFTTVPPAKTSTSIRARCSRIRITARNRIRRSGSCRSSRTPKPTI